MGPIDMCGPTSGENTHKEDSGSPTEPMEAVLKHDSDVNDTFEDKYMNILRDFLSSSFTSSQPN